jgi:hypothetical protein
MRKAIRNMAIAGCLVLSTALLGASRPPKSKVAQRVMKVARAIQEAVAKDRSLSTAGRNIEVTVEQGVIILKGMVLSDEESQAIQGKAESLVIQATPDWLLQNSRLVEIDNDLEVVRRR